MSATSELFTPAYRPETPILELGPEYYDPVQAAKFPEAKLRFRNQRWAQAVGLDKLDKATWRSHFWAFNPLPNNIPRPIAMRYHGHQFMQYNPALGDGRGFLFAQVRAEDQRLLDLGTKGTGTTSYSRGGDGRLTLLGGIREVLAASLLEARGVYTSKAFSLFETGESLTRHDEPSPTRASVLVRLSHSHLRIGTFQRLAWNRDDAGLEKLLRHVIHNYPSSVQPQLCGPEDDLQSLAPVWLSSFVRRCARLVAQWTAAGFVHGVLNTDNLNVTGESFDYGPFRFLETFDPGFVAAYFDHHGLYAFGRQGPMVAWALERLAESLSRIIPAENLQPALDRFAPTFAASLEGRFLSRLGLKAQSDEANQDLVQALMTFLRSSQVPFEGAFFDLFCFSADPSRASASPRASFYRGENWERLRGQLQNFEADRPQRLEHGYFQQTNPCDLLITEIEALWEPIAKRDDWSAFETKLAEIENLRQALDLYPDPPIPNH